MVDPGSHRITRVLWYSGTPSAHFAFAYGTVTLCGRTFQTGSASYFRIVNGSPTTPKDMSLGLASSPFARRYWGNLC
jgi:hypothetical protein